MCFDWDKESENIEILINKFVTECNTRRVKSIEEMLDNESLENLKLKITFDNDETIHFLCPGFVQFELLQYFCFPESNQYITVFYPNIAQKIDLLRTN